MLTFSERKLFAWRATCLSIGKPKKAFSEITSSFLFECISSVVSVFISATAKSLTISKCGSEFRYKYLRSCNPWTQSAFRLDIRFPLKSKDTRFSRCFSAFVGTDTRWFDFRLSWVSLGTCISSLYSESHKTVATLLFSTLNVFRVVTLWNKETTCQEKYKRLNTKHGSVCVWSNEKDLIRIDRFANYPEIFCTDLLVTGRYDIEASELLITVLTEHTVVRSYRRSSCMSLKSMFRSVKERNRLNDDTGTVANLLSLRLRILKEPKPEKMWSAKTRMMHNQQTCVNLIKDGAKKACAMRAKWVVSLLCPHWLCAHQFSQFFGHFYKLGSLKKCFPFLAMGLRFQPGSSWISLPIRFRCVSAVRSPNTFSRVSARIWLWLRSSSNSDTSPCVHGTVIFIRTNDTDTTAAGKRVWQACGEATNHFSAKSWLHSGEQTLNVSALMEVSRLLCRRRNFSLGSASKTLRSMLIKALSLRSSSSRLEYDTISEISCVIWFPRRISCLIPTGSGRFQGMWVSPARVQSTTCIQNCAMIDRMVSIACATFSLFQPKHEFPAFCQNFHTLRLCHEFSPPITNADEDSMAD